MKAIVNRLGKSSHIQFAILTAIVMLAALALAVAWATPKGFASQVSAQNAASPGGRTDRGAVPVLLFANVLVNNNDGISNCTFFTQSTTSIVSFDNIIVCGFNDSGSTSFGAHVTGWSRSTDGGVTWTDGSQLPNSSFGDAGDPSLPRNSNTGRIYFATLGLTDVNAIPVFRSDDEGVMWQAPVNGTPGGNDEDKE